LEDDENVELEDVASAAGEEGSLGEGGDAGEDGDLGEGVADTHDDSTDRDDDD
jgi:hypothetical protein